jgi:hypothetical protein
VIDAKILAFPKSNPRARRGLEREISAAIAADRRRMREVMLHPAAHGENVCRSPI